MVVVKTTSKLLNKKIINYDINPYLSEIDNIENVNFNIIIFNHVLMYMHKDRIAKITGLYKII